MKLNLSSRNFRHGSAAKVAIPALFVLAVSCAHGALTLQTQVNNGAAPTPLLPLAGDLLETSVFSSSGENAGALVRNGAVTGFPSENTPGTFPAEVWNQSTTTYDFDLSVNTVGYDITAIQAYSAWADDRASQSYRIFYALVGAPATFLQLGGDIEVFGANASVITRSHDSTPGVAILNNVSSIRFQQYDGPATDGPGTVFRELDVVGVASIPEPTTSVLGLCGAVLLLYRRRS